jgi:hypothetical protein
MASCQYLYVEKASKNYVSRELLYRQAMHIYLAFTAIESCVLWVETLMSRSILYLDYRELSTFARYVAPELLSTNAHFRAKAVAVRLQR